MQTEPRLFRTSDDEARFIKQALALCRTPRNDGEFLEYALSVVRQARKILKDATKRKKNTPSLNELSIPPDRSRLH
jgi:hypothetical protein